MHIYIYTCTEIHICIHPCTHIYNIYRDTSTHIHMHTLRVTNTYTQTHKHTYTQQLYIYIHIHTYTHIYRDTHTHIRYTWRHIWSQTHTQSLGKDSTWTPHLHFPSFKPVCSSFCLLSEVASLELSKRPRGVETTLPALNGILIWGEDTCTPMNTDKATGSKASYDVSRVRCVH